MTVHCETEVPSTFRHVVTVDAHTLHADVGKALGGENSAPGPHEYFDTSLATCKALTAMWFAKRKSIPLEKVDVFVERDDSKERQGTYVLNVKLAFHGPMSDEQRAELYAAAGKCPIHKLMTTTTVEIVTAPL
jgi:putative redox protein